MSGNSHKVIFSIVEQKMYSLFVWLFSTVQFLKTKTRIILLCQWQCNRITSGSSLRQRGARASLQVPSSIILFQNRLRVSQVCWSFFSFVQCIFPPGHAWSAPQGEQNVLKPKIWNNPNQKFWNNKRIGNRTCLKYHSLTHLTTFQSR